MSTWDEAAGLYRKRLHEVLEVQRRALDLAALPQADVAATLSDQFQRHHGPFQRQYERLAEKEFRIAVVGLEKAGKSTFVNAWLECDLLPNETSRCTYTTTQVYSVGSEGEARLEVVAKTQVQFDGMVRDLETLAQGTDERATKARNDLDALRAHRPLLQEVLRQGHFRQTFTRLEEIAPKLRQYVADPRYSYAVLEARLYTRQLAAIDGIVFYDVPGLNSGLTIHEQQAEQMLADCDAVILIQRISTPSLEGSEQKLIRYVAEGDDQVAVADKLFVFLGRIDQEGTPEIFTENRAKALEEWKRRAQLPPDRIIEGSAAAFLLLHHLAGLHLSKALDQERTRRNLEHVTGAKHPDSLRRATGLPVIKERINRYLQNERVGVLKKRCDGPMRATLDAARQIFADVRRRFPEDPQEAQRQQEEQRRIDFARWWGAEWQDLLARLTRHFEQVTAGGEPSEEAARTRADQALRTRYDILLRERLVSLPSRTPLVRQRIFGMNAIPLFLPLKANAAWRERLHADVSRMIEDVSRGLALELKDEARGLVDFMRDDLLYGSRKVGELLIGREDEFVARLEGKLQTLFLRFARPLVEALIRLPVGDPGRRQLLARLGPDIDLLDNYYAGDEPAYLQLKYYAKYGRDLLVHEPLRRRLLNVEETARPDRITSPDLVHLPRQAETPEEVTLEVEADLQALEVYLSQAVFAAAGFAAFRAQELGRLRDRFSIDEKDAWFGVALNEYYHNNPKLRERLPAPLRTQEFDTEVSDRLRQLRIALDAVASEA